MAMLVVVVMILNIFVLTMDVQIASATASGSGGTVPVGERRRGQLPKATPPLVPKGTAGTKRAQAGTVKKTKKNISKF